MRKTFQRLLLLFLFGVVGLATAGTESSFVDLTTVEDGVYTIQDSAVYLIRAAGSPGVTKEYALTTAGSYVNAALQIQLGDQNNTIILRLSAFRLQIEGLQDKSGNYVPAIKVTGTGTLIIRHENTDKAVHLRVKDKAGGEQPIIDLSGMTGGEVRFERDGDENGTTWLWLQRVWAIATNDHSAGNFSKPVIIGNSKVRLTFAAQARVRFQASACVVKSEPPSYVLPEMISNGYVALRIEEGAVVSLYPYWASQSAKTTVGDAWTVQPFFPKIITLAGGCLELADYSGDAFVDIPSTSVKTAIALVRGQGEAFGKKIFTVSTQSSVVPESCIKVAEGSMLTKKELTVKNGCLIIAATKSPELVYAQTSESDQNAVTVFGLTPEITETGCTIKCNFGIADLKVDKVDSTGFVSTLKVSVDLPNETVSPRAFYLRVLQTSPNGTETTIYPISGTAALTTFTRDAAGSSRFSASIPCRITPSRGTTSITVRAYSTPPTK